MGPDQGAGDVPSELRKDLEGEKAVPAVLAEGDCAPGQGLGHPPQILVDLRVLENCHSELNGPHS